MNQIRFELNVGANTDHPFAVINIGDRISEAYFPEYAFLDERLKSFDTWPEWAKVSKDPLCAAGFFYSKKSDRVICFHCGGSLHDWTVDDLPWEQHALWYGNCAFVELNYGKDSIEKVRQRFSHIVPLEETVIDEVKKSESEINSCKICFENEYNVAFVPCGHINSCIKCAKKLDKCPTCRNKFEKFMRIYFS